MMTERTTENENVVQFFAEVNISGNKPYITTFSDKNGKNLSNFYFWNMPGNEGYNLEQLESMKEVIQDCIDYLNKKDAYTSQLFE